MRGAGFKIGRVFGIPIYLHSSWFLIFALITYQFGSEFSSTNPNWTAGQGWSLGLLTSALFFGSVLFHELSHSIVAIRYRLPVSSITLFFFGGVARISREPDRPGQEFLIAAAGPVSSYFLAACFWLLAFYAPQHSMAAELGGQLSWINAMLATFNLVPGFPLDGGRLLRSIIWGITKNYTRATRIAAVGGQMVAYGMMAIGLWIAVQGYLAGRDVIGGLWWVFIGWFLLTVARQSYAQVAARGALEGLRVSDIMTSDMATVQRDISLEEYAREVARTGRRAHLVMSGRPARGIDDRRGAAKRAARRMADELGASGDAVARRFAARGAGRFRGRTARAHAQLERRPDGGDHGRKHCGHSDARFHFARGTNPQRCWTSHRIAQLAFFNSVLAESRFPLLLRRSL